MSLLLNLEKAINGSNVDNLTYITNCNDHSKSMQNLLFHRFIFVKHKCRALFKHESCVYNFRVQTTQIAIQHPCLNNMNRHRTFVFKQCAQYQCSNNTSRWMTFMFIPYEPMKNKFCMTTIAKSWSIKFVMYLIMKYLMECAVRQLIRLKPNLFVHYGKKWYFTIGFAI
jgi:hypothetical protein